MSRERGGKMDLKEVKDLVDFMNENDLLELEIEKEGMRVRLKKSSPSDMTPQVTVLPQNNAQASAADKEEVKSDSGIEIKAPMVGTFYRSPAPDAKSYVEVGQVVQEGQVLCIIEAMKLMNEIKAEAKVKIVDILIENGDPVEFSQPIFIAEPVKG